MKYAIFAVALLALALTACKHMEVVTIQPDGTSVTNIVSRVDIERVARVTGAIAEEGTIIWLAERPDDRRYFEAVITTLNGLLADEQFTPQALSQALRVLPMNELKSTEAKLAFSTGRILLLEAFHEVATVLEGQQLIRQTILELRAGFERGLALSGSSTI